MATQICGTCGSSKTVADEGWNEVHVAYCAACTSAGRHLPSYAEAFEQGIRLESELKSECAGAAFGIDPATRARAARRSKEARAALYAWLDTLSQDMQLRYGVFRTEWRAA